MTSNPAPDPLDLACAQGYAEAVARLRDDERYRTWWTAEADAAHPWSSSGAGRRHLADYLETVGPAGMPHIGEPAAVGDVSEAVS